jgi:cyanate permease
LRSGLNSALHWQTTLLIFAAIVLLTMPLSLALAKPREAANGAGQAESQSVQQAVREALSTRSYILLVTGYFTCGFQLFFITVHLPAYLVDRGISVEIGAWTLAIIGLFNIIGSLGSGFLATRLPKRYILAAIYFAAFARNPRIHSTFRCRHWIAR